ncbi:hypothetical protein [Treponema primitia]|uniref:ribonuclease toxin HepT-like protein n=1 Tax=Treponema primitia TaxID=88058 RepID=UPI00025557A2|nr:hypothetical protein [Treponema primitia]
MNNVLKEKIEHEISRINKLFDKTKPLVDLCKIKEPDYIEASAAALFLHSLYNGIESIILLILKNIGEPIPNDFQWHKTLFEKTYEQNAKRTKIFTNDYKEQLEEYLSFRHFIRHSYGSEIEWSRLKPLINYSEELWKKVKDDFEQFIKNN